MAATVAAEVYPVLTSAVDPTTADFQAKAAAMSELCGRLATELEKARFEGPESTVARHRSHGKLTARERVDLLLDVDSPFLELLPLAGLGQKDMILGGGNVCGIGLVAGVEVLVTANVSTLKGGSVDECGLLKAGRVAQIARQCALPTVTLVESAGANLGQQFKVFHRGGAGFREITQRSADGLPSVAVVFGSCTAGGAYTPGMSDYVIMVKGNAKVFLAGPPLVKMATGEETDDETLGGAEMHSRVSGLSDYLADNEAAAIVRAREVVASLNFRKRSTLPPEHWAWVEEPLFSPEQLLGIAGTDLRVSFDAREVIARIVDGSRFSEFKALFGATMVTGWARIHGVPVGILANNGPIFPDSANKATQFIELCDFRNIPLLYLQNITGFVVGKKYEQEGITRHGSKLINAVSNAGVPAITIMIGASYGAGNYAMCGRAYEPRFLFAWPQSRVAVMGPEQLGGVMDIVMRQAARRRGMALTEDMALAQRKRFVDQVEAQSDAFYVTAHCIDDGIIDPRDTRAVLGVCLSAVYSGVVAGSRLYGVSRM